MVLPAFFVALLVGLPKSDYGSHAVPIVVAALSTAALMPVTSTALAITLGMVLGALGAVLWFKRRQPADHSRHS